MSLFKKISKYEADMENSVRSVATHFEKITHFEKKFQSALNLGPNQRTLKNFFQSALRVYINITFRTLKKT